MSESIDIIKKTIFYRAHHRGTKEADWVIGGFVRAYLNTLTDEEIYALKVLVDLDDESFFLQISNPDESLKVVAEKFISYKAGL